MGRLLRTRFSTGSTGYDSGGYIRLNAYIDESAILGQANNELLDYNTRLEIMQLAADLVDPYVPYLHGPLSSNLKITPAYVEYSQPYARKQFYGNHFNFTKDPHPLAQAHWTDVLKVGEEQREAFEEGVRQIILRRAKELYG